jgi:uncharacterized membrane protein (DUF485 family)
MNAAPNDSPAAAPTPDDWSRVARSREFKELAAQKKRLVLPAFLFFFVYFLALPALIGFAPRFMSTRVIGTVTLAYLFAVSQFAVGGIIAWLYVRRSSKLDLLAKDLVARHRLHGDE